MASWIAFVDWGEGLALSTSQIASRIVTARYLLPNRGGGKSQHEAQIEVLWAGSRLPEMARRNPTAFRAEWPFLFEN